ncbi:MAG: hypothetical protein ABIR24_06520 [Verrucomicrobiota bacterium]
MIYLVAGLLAVSVPQLTRAEDAKKPEGRPDREELRKEFQNLTPEEREAKKKEFVEKRGEEMKKAAKDLGLDQEELKKLSPEERRAKIKEAVEKKLTELQKKKTDGTITDSEKETLQKLEQRKKMLEGQRGEGGPGARPHRKPGAEKPADK